MAKIKVSADTVLSVLQGIMNDEEINYKITDVSAPEDWQGKTVQEALNVEYYTFKHRPMDTEAVIRDLIEKGLPANALYSLSRSFCLLSIEDFTRTFSKDIDIVTVNASLEYWLQTDKIKLLENMFEDISIETSGIRLPIEIGGERRQVMIGLSSLNVQEIEEETEFGEMAVCSLQIEMVFYQDVYSRADYTLEFLMKGLTAEATSWVKVPFISLSIPINMTQKAVPRANRVRDVGNINQSRIKSFTIAFDGYKNDFIDYLSESSLESDFGNQNNDQDNNEQFIMRITRGSKQYIYDCVIKEHTISVGEDGGNEVHNLTLTTRGMKNGT